VLLEEARWLSERLAEFNTPELSPLIDLGSSTGHFRQVEQPYIDSLIFRPLAERGCRVFHVDQKAGEGVDVVADIFSEASRAEISALQPRTIIAANILEHVPDPDEVLKLLFDLLPVGGTLFLTVPFSFPYHADPIDTLLRPTPSQVRRMCRPHHVQRCDVVKGKTLIGEVLSRRAQRKRGEPTLGEGWRPRAQVLWHLLWLFRCYSETCAVIVKSANSSPT
jgi:hypothetical protein